MWGCVQGRKTQKCQIIIVATNYKVFTVYARPWLSTLHVLAHLIIRTTLDC